VDGYLSALVIVINFSAVLQLMVCEALDIVKETYFAILLDRASSGPVMVASAEGGVDIEEVFGLADFGSWLPKSRSSAHSPNGLVISMRHHENTTGSSQANALRLRGYMRCNSCRAHILWLLCAGRALSPGCDLQGVY
jgi:hypothetical protein